MYHKLTNLSFSRFLLFPVLSLCCAYPSNRFHCPLPSAIYHLPITIYHLFISPYLHISASPYLLPNNKTLTHLPTLHPPTLAANVKSKNITAKLGGKLDEISSLVPLDFVKNLILVSLTCSRSKHSC